MNLFISYGHDEYAPMAARLKADLVKHGYNVWYDADKLIPGYDWEKYIEDGLNSLIDGQDHNCNGKVIFIMTPHSTRRPDGFCLNELSMAISRGISIIPVMLVKVEPPLSIHRLHYLDFQNCFPPDLNEEIYCQRFERLIEALEHDEIELDDWYSVRGKLLPAMDFKADLEKLVCGFSGRKWLLEKIQHWMEDPAGSKIFWLTGVPGSGKSSVAAYLCNNFREIAAIHFCDIQSEEKRDALRIIMSLALQLATQLPEYESRLKLIDLQYCITHYREPATLFDKIVKEIISSGFPDPNRLVVLLIDAIDEASNNHRNEILSVITQCIGTTPGWFRLLITSRPDPMIVANLEPLNQTVIDINCIENQLDIEQYILEKIPGISVRNLDTLINRSEGVFLFITMIIESLRKNEITFNFLEDFPKGLGSVYMNYFNRLFNNNLDAFRKEVRRLLSLMIVAYEPLDETFLVRLGGFQDKMELYDVRLRLESLIQVVTIKSQKYFRFYHSSLITWLEDSSVSGIYYIDSDTGHERISDYGFRKSQTDTENLDNYFLKYLPRHLFQSGRFQELTLLFKDFSFSMERTKSGFLELMIKDCQELIPQLPSKFRNQLYSEFIFYTGKAHILRRANEKWPAYKILFQLAIEHADNSPITESCEKYLASALVNWPYARVRSRPENSDRTSLILTFEGHKHRVKDIYFLENKRFISADNRKIIVWQENGTMCSSLNRLHRGLNRILKLENEKIVYWGLSSKIILIDRTGNICKEIDLNRNVVGGVIPISNGGFFVFCNDKKGRLFNANGELISEFAGHDERIVRVIELNEEKLLTYGLDHTIKIWTFNGDLLWNFVEHDNDIKGVIELSNHRILSWSDDKTLIIWDIDTGSHLALRGHRSFVSGAIDLGNSRILSWAFDKTIRIWDYQGRLRKTLKVCDVTIENVGKLTNNNLLVWSMAKDLFIIDKQGRIISNLCSGESYIDGAFELSNGNIIAWFGDFSIKIFSMSGELLAKYTGHSNLIKQVSEYTPGRIFSKSLDNTIKIWDITSGNSLASGHHSGRITGLTKLKSGRLVTWGYDKIIKIWNPDGVLLYNLEGHNWWVERVIELEDNKLVSWSLDNTIRIWTEEGKNEYVFPFDEIINPPEAFLNLIGIDFDGWLNIYKAIPPGKYGQTNNLKLQILSKEKCCRITDGSVPDNTSVYWHSDYELTVGLGLSKDKAVVASSVGVVSVIQLSVPQTDRHSLWSD